MRRGGINGALAIRVEGVFLFRPGIAAWLLATRGGLDPTGLGETIAGAALLAIACFAERAAIAFDATEPQMYSDILTGHVVLVTAFVTPAIFDP